MTIHLISAAVIITAFLTSSVSEILISHYVNWVDRQAMATMVIVKGVLILFVGLAFVYDISDFDRSSIDWFVPLLIAGVYLVLCGFTTWQILKPRSVLSHSIRT